MRYIYVLAAAAALGGLGGISSGCGEEDSPVAPGGGSGGKGGGGDEGPKLGQVIWRPCDIGQTRMDCTTVDVPLDWSDEESPRIEYFVRRIPARQPVSKGQAWLLVGGPGTSGAGILGAVGLFSNRGWDVYIPDYRGVGASTSLVCASSIGDTPHQGCIKEISDRFGDGTIHFSTTGAAMDMGKFIEAIRRQEEKVFVLGGSYGAFLGNRYLNLFPGQADAAILGGICPPTGCSLHTGLNMDRAAELVMNACGEDEFCSGKLGPDPWEKFGDLLAKLEGDHCSELGPERSRGLSSIIAATISRRDLMPAALATVYRAERCSPGDVQAIKSIGTVFAPGRFDDSHGEVQSSGFLYWNITLSEFWEEGLTIEELQEEESLLTIHSRVAQMASTWMTALSWPRYDTEKELKRWAPVTIPLLLMNGEVDAHTPLWDILDAEDVYSAPGQHLVSLPMSGHGSHQSACGQQIMTQFIEDPSADLDLGCLETLREVDFRGSFQLANLTMGTDDLWEDDESIVGAAITQPDPDLVRAIEEARSGALGW